MNKVQEKKKKRPNKKRKWARAQHNKNGMIIETQLGVIGNEDKDRLEKHFAKRDNVGFVEYMKSKRCYKYKTVRVTLRFSNAYEKIYNEGGVNMSLTRRNQNYFLRMFDSRLSYGEIKDKFR
ncbi:hypothetical protein RhiirA4_472776 [Rhizophagus irregularis]|uniref:Uncharacterized protein n=1 Tax=Rhizophagus irregularis TaxID=588596 RepID=A0A2I1H5M0_9GLOM|nr:hypothetical protein RhiirA4_472776 [Rhizophagus irregularis]